WEMEKELAERFVSLGVFRSALEIYERLETWDEVISCYQMLEKKDIAERMVREQLVLHPESPKLLCILGDLKTDPSYWEQAWTVSHERYARAMRSLGGYHYRQGHYAESVTCYDRALKLNPLFENSWFMLGCAAIQAEEWATAVRAFLRVITLDDDNGEAWSNLASCYMKLDQKQDAFAAYRQAVRKCHESWRIWTNYLYMALELGYYSEAITALGRVVTLGFAKHGEQCLDLDALQSIIRAAIRGVTDAHGASVAIQANMIDRLLVDTIMTRVSNIPRVWRLAAEFWTWRGRYAQALDAHLKAYRCLVTNPAFDTSMDVFRDVVNEALDLVNAYRFLGPKPMGSSDAVVAKDWNYQARLILRSLITRTKRIIENREMVGTSSGDDPELEECRQLQEKLSECLAELKQKK
ncbi:hypothetical protein BJ085DRAFT_21969, partial [Dimargaris cristalligena]